MEYVGVVCELMRLLSVTDKCKKQRKCQIWAQLQRAFLPPFENSGAISAVSSGCYGTQSQGYSNCLKLCDYTMRHLTASAFVCSHPVDYQRQESSSLI